MPDASDDARRAREGDLRDNVFRYALAAESYEVKPPVAAPVVAFCCVHVCEHCRLVSVI